MQIFTGMYNLPLQVWRSGQGDGMRIAPCFCISPDGGSFADGRCAYQLLGPNHKEQIFVFEMLAQDGVKAVCSWSPDGSRIVCMRGHSIVLMDVFDAVTGRLLWRRPLARGCSEYTKLNLLFSPNGCHLAVWEPCDASIMVLSPSVLFL